MADFATGRQQEEKRQITMKTHPALAHSDESNHICSFSFAEENCFTIIILSS